ncbi:MULTISPECIES: hypothetical protein [unclassified Microbacterium]|uniref:hypothetical protein n=1 Tax=unclassified Microbacterium TaxID=2609290 RepID=UPI002040CBB9|nr:hypothetical protein [Microbacterium sp. USTB-Y]
MRELSMVSAVVLKLWVREVAKILGTTTRTVTVAAGSSVVVMLLFGLALALIAGAQLGSAISPELRLSLVRTSFAAAAMTAGIVAVVLCLAAPPRTALQNSLDLLPVGRGSARLGQLVPVLAMGLVSSAALSSTSVVVLVRTSPDPLGMARGLVLYALLLLSMMLAAVAVFSGLQSVGMKRLRLPLPYASTVAGVLTFAGVLAVAAPDILALRRSGSGGDGIGELLPSRVFARTAVAPDGWSAALVVLWILVAAGLLWFVSRHHVPGAPRTSVRLLRGTRPLRRTPWWGQLWAEGLIAIRNPQFVVAALMLPLGAAAVWVLAVTVPAAGIIVPALAGALPVLPFVLAVHAVGRTIRTHWVARLAGGDAVPLLWPKALAAALSGAVLGAPILLAVLLLGLVPAMQLPDILLRCALGLVAGLLGGAVVPYSEEQPLSATAAGFLVALIYMPATLAAGWVSTVAAPGTDRVIVLAAIVVLAGLFAVVAVRQRVQDPARA